MDTGFKHKILIVDNEPSAAKAISRILEQKNLPHTIADSGESALKRIKESKRPFSIVIADQRMKNMQGTQLLEAVKKISPESQRFLITAHSDIDTIMEAVNIGSIQRYIPKPWDMDDFLNALGQGLKQYERHLESEKLLKLAKKQNAKLYQLNCELMDQSKSYDQQMQSLDEQINEIQRQIKSLTSDDDAADLQNLVQTLENEIQGANQEGTAHLERIYATTIRQLYSQFSDLAQRNGFEIPVPGKGSAC